MVHRTERKLQDGFLHQKAFFLSQTGVEILVCGAISMSLHEMIKSYGITVIPFVTGNLDVVIQAWSGKKFSADAFTMPGFNRRRQRRFHETGHCFREEHPVNTKGRGGTGQGGGGCRRSGTGGGQNTSGFCVCPQCDHREPHERGTPCFEKKMSKMWSCAE